jgi:AraC-like DNA-binding protein
VCKPANPSYALDPPVDGEIVQHSAGKTIGRHAHVAGQFSVVLKGSMRIRCGDGWWLAPAGRGVWIPAGTEHSATYSEMASLVLLKISPHAAAMPPTVRSIAVSDLLRELSLEFVRSALRKREPEDAELMSTLILRRIRHAEATSFLFLPSGNDARVLRVTEFLRNDPANAASFDVLAKMAGSSRRTLSRLFLADTGMTFARWRNHLRIVTALDMLVRQVPIVQIAMELGYSSQSSFTTMFTRIIGVSPGRYLREMTERCEHMR